jgi:arylsulfatase A-like enzyme
MSRLKPLALLLSMFAAQVAGCSSDTSARPPDVILIAVDTLRADRLGCYGYGEGTSPNIDRFAADALVFENALSHGSDTLLSCAALVSGYLPHETRIIGRDDLPLEVPTLAETLQSQGYETAAVISNYVLRDGQGFEQGFETYDSEMGQHELTRGFPERLAEFTTDRAIEILAEERDRPLFLWVHYQDPHGPYTPPEMFVRAEAGGGGRALPLNPDVSGRGGIPVYQQLENRVDPRFYASRYDGEIRYTDDQFARLIRALEHQGMYEDAVIVFTADHGEGMGEHDYWFAHGEYLYQGQIHVPLIVRWGDRFGGRRAEFVQHVDVVPTILGLLGFPGADSLRGTDLFAESTSPRSIVSFAPAPSLDESKVSLVRDGMKVTYTPRHRAVQFHDLLEDPGEEASLTGNSPQMDVAREMMTELQRVRVEDRLRIEPPEARTPTAEELEKLKSLGYVR